MKTILVMLSALLLSANASAAYIHGQIGWGGEFARVGDDFTFSNVEVDMATGDLAATIADNDTLTANGFNIAAFAPGEHWSLGGFTFTLNRIRVVMDDFGFTGILGQGKLTHQDYDPTSFAFSFSSNPGGTFSASAVPEPATLALLGLGLAGLGLQRRRSRLAL